MVSLIPKSIMSHFLDTNLNKNMNTNYFQINDCLQVGTRVIIDGQINPAAAKFELNLISGVTLTKEVIKSGDIALHLSVNPSGCYALTNSRINKVWGREERTPRGRLPRPLLQNQKFRLTIIVEQSCYQLDVNDRNFISFAHRMPFNSIGLVSYEGDASIDNIEVQKLATTDQMMPLPPLVPPPQNTDSYDNISSDHVLYHITYPRLPFILPIKCGLQPGMVISITGRTIDNRFDLGLYQGSNPYEDPNSDVALHMEVYIKEMSIVRNSHQSNQWRNTERYLEHFPFFVNCDFKIIIRVESNRYMVSVNGKHLFDFYHRVLPLNSIDHVCIHGGLEISSICVMNPPL